MNAAALVSGDFVRSGGMDMANYALARRLAERGVSTHVVAHRIAGDLDQNPRVVWHRVPRPLGSDLCGYPLLEARGRWVARGVRRARGRVIANGGNCQIDDVNWVHYVHAAAEIEHRGSWLRRIKGQVDRRVYLARERAVLRRAELVIANSERTREHLEALLGLDPRRIRTVYLGVDPERFAPISPERRARARAALGVPERPQLAFVGALGDRRKGFDTLFAAWSRVCARSSWDADLLVVGRGAELASFRTRAQREGLGDRVRFLGFRSDVPEVLAACDALVAPSRYEPYGLGVHEALCSGLPAIVGVRAGVAERFTPALAPLLLDDVESASELALRLEAWRSDVDRFRGAALELSAVLRQRTWDVMADELIALLD